MNKIANKPIKISGLILAIILILLIIFRNEETHIVFPDNFKGQAGIIFGIEGYAPLQSSGFWHRTIEIPDTGIMITSSREEIVSDDLIYYFRNGSKADESKINWVPNADYYCVVNGSLIKAWLFGVDNSSGAQVQRKQVDLANMINQGKIHSVYSTPLRFISRDEPGDNLSLPSLNLYYLPEAIAALDLQEVNLTNNNFREIPNEVLKMKNLEKLSMGYNPMTDINPGILALRRLKYLNLSGTRIFDIRTDLSAMDSLEEFDFSSNGAYHVPQQVSHIPHLKSLSVHDNRLRDLSFIDARMREVEKLYVNSNWIKRISREIEFLSNLRELKIFDNRIDSIPESIASLTHLEKFEIWDNPIRYISPAIRNCQRLRELSIDDDLLTAKDKENLKNWLPHCLINFQKRNDKRH